MPTNHNIENALNHLITMPSTNKQILFAGNQPAPPQLAYQVDFPRFEFVLEGELSMEVGNTGPEKILTSLTPDKILFLPDYSWNKPQWDDPVTTLSLLCGRQAIGLSLMHWDGTAFEAPEKLSIPRRGPRVGTFIVRALNELSWHPEDQATALLLVRSLLTNTLDLLDHPPETPSQGHAVFEAIRDYIDNHYQEHLSRESIAAEFYISPNYLSQLFHREGGIKFNDYLIQARLEKAKYLLKQYDMKVKEVAYNCGFSDSNYFCRSFRKKTGRSPSEYRVQYRSH